MPDCVLWDGYVMGNGYGTVGRHALAHRVMWESIHGPIPSDYQLHHVCGIKRCVNVEHLRCVSRPEHNAEHRNDHCPQGHEFTPENTKFRRDRRTAHRHGWTRYCVACHRVQSRETMRRKRERERLGCRGAA